MNHKINLAGIGMLVCLATVQVSAKPANNVVRKDVSCQFKSEFDDTIPADVSYIKLGAQPFKKFIVDPDYFSSRIEDCQLHGGRYYVLSVSQSHPARTLAQSLIGVTQFDLTGKKLSQKFYNKAWTCELKQGFIVKNQRLLIDTQCAEKSNFDEYGDMIDPKQKKSYQIEVK